MRSRLAEYKRQIESGARRFEDLAREFSLDGSASAGGDLGWTSPGQFVPEFEQAMNALAIGGISAPVGSRFGVHLIQVMERRSVAPDTKQLRDQARQALRERKFEEAYNEWVREVRGRAYVEFREAAASDLAPRSEAPARASASASTSSPTRRCSMRSCTRSIRKPGAGAGRDRPRAGRADAAAARTLRRLTVIELDRDLAARLRRNAALEVIEADVLTVDSPRWRRSAARRLRIVGNLPYNISTPILFHLLRPRRRSRTSTSCCRRKSCSAWPPARAARPTGACR